MHEGYIDDVLFIIKEVDPSLPKFFQEFHEYATEYQRE